MNLKQNKPEIEFMVYCKETKKIYKDIDTIEYKPNNKIDFIRVISNYSEEQGFKFLEIHNFILLPYTNCKDINDNKLYLLDAVKLSITDNTIFIVIWNVDRYCLYDLKFEVSLALNKVISKKSKKLGNIYELQELQKEFNIEV